MAKKTPKNDRLYLRISEKQKKEIKEYAERHDTSPSDLVSRFFENLLARERRNRVVKSTPKKFF